MTVYIFENNFLEWLLKFHKEASDFSTQIIPELLGKIYAYQVDSIYIDIGTFPNLQKAILLANNLK